MKSISDLKQGDVIYDIDSQRVKCYRYLCVHPTGKGKYHILIDDYENPVRIYGEKLQTTLNMGLATYQEAKMALANRLDEVVSTLRREEESLS